MLENPETTTAKEKEIALNFLAAWSRILCNKETEVFLHWKENNGVTKIDEDVLHEKVNERNF